HREQDDAARLAQLLAIAARLDMQPLAAGDVHMDVRRRRALQDTMTAIRHNLPLAECGAQLFRNGERHLRTRRALGNIHGATLMDNAVQLARRCSFDLERTSATPIRSNWCRKATRRPRGCANSPCAECKRAGPKG